MKRSAPVLILIVCTLLAGCAGMEAEKVCEVHQVALQQKKVPVAYGMPFFQDYDRTMAEEANRSFPHAVVSVEGGCVVPKRGPHKVKVFQCPTCIQEKAKWVAAHPRPVGG